MMELSMIFMGLLSLYILILPVLIHANLSQQTKLLTEIRDLLKRKDGDA